MRRYPDLQSYLRSGERSIECIIPDGYFYLRDSKNDNRTFSASIVGLEKEIQTMESNLLSQLILHRKIRQRKVILKEARELLKLFEHSCQDRIIGCADYPSIIQTYEPARIRT